MSPDAVHQLKTWRIYAVVVVILTQNIISITLQESATAILKAFHLRRYHKENNHKEENPQSIQTPRSQLPLKA